MESKRNLMEEAAEPWTSVQEKSAGAGFSLATARGLIEPYVRKAIFPALSLLIVSFLGLQMFVSFPHEIARQHISERYGELPFITQCDICPVKLWPFLDYPMYSRAYHEGDQLARYVAIGILEDDTEVHIEYDDLGNDRSYFHNHMIKGMVRGNLDRIEKAARAYQQENNQVLAALRLENHPWVLTRDGLKTDAPPQIVSTVRLISDNAETSDIAIAPRNSVVIEDFEDISDLEVSSGDGAAVTVNATTGLLNQGYHVNFAGGGWWNISKDTSGLDFSTYQGINVSVKGSGEVRLQLIEESVDGGDGERWTVSIPLTEEWKLLNYAWSDFSLDDKYERNGELDRDSIEGIQVKHAGGAENGYLVLDTLGLSNKPG